MTLAANPTRILVARPDRLGDVVLSTPVFEALKHHHPGCEVTALVRGNVVPVLRGLSSIDRLFVFEPDAGGRHAGLAGFFRLIRELREGQYRIAIVLQSHWKIAAAIFLARVRYRIGPLSRPHSFFFYNRGMRQGRSNVEMHETDYNLQLLRRIGIRVPGRTIGPKVAVSETVREAGLTLLREQGWDGVAPLIAVHPGMGGSALNWPEEHYLELVRKLLAEGRTVLLTGGPGEHALLERLRAGAGQAPGVATGRLLVYAATPQKTVEDLGGVLWWASVMVAPSTGPLHLATALGIRVVTFYPPIRVQSALRWGPYLTEEERGSVLVPEVFCGEDFRCRLQLCHYYPCMKTLTVADALEHVHRQLEHAAPGPGVPTAN